MKKDFISRPSGSDKNEPKVIAEVLNEYFQSNEPLAVAFRNWKAKSEVAMAAEKEGETDLLFKDIFPNTELSVNLKLFTRKPGRLPVGAYFDGTITRKSEDDFIFVQNAEKKVSVWRNPHIYRGKYVNVVKRRDGMSVPTFCTPHYSLKFTFADFCREAAKELLVVAGLIEK